MMNKVLSSMAIDGREVANFVLDYSEQSGRSLTNLALQKVIYFCHVWTLIDFEKPLVKQKFEAWKYGPVLPYIHRQFKQFERSPISERAKRLNTSSGVNEIARYKFSDGQISHLVEVLNFYTRLNAGQLVELSHVKGGPWDIVWNHHGRTNPGMKISDNDIVRFYSEIRRPFSVQ